ncbi:FAS1 domain-containing protein SELMODRAFT_448915-like [Silene latifolia]|uniref:FAS1 domain-containing protein SELMODRAFT_448915-like n=1 Tax=Silene latifolia TaxID=37657 RepID=UPI003D76F216
MASTSTSTSALLFIISLLLTTATATTNTTTATHKQTNTTTPHTTHKQAQLNTIMDAIIGASDFTSWSKLLSGADISTIPLSATVFIPITASASATASPVENSNSPVLLPYHIIRRRFSFAELQLFPTGTRLPTLLPGTTLCITNNSAVNFTVNGDKLTEPNLFQNDIVCVHGVEGLLRLSNLSVSTSPPPRSVGFKGSDASVTQPRRYPPRVTGRKPPRVSGRRPRFVWVSSGVSGSCSWVRVIVGLVIPCILKGIFGITVDGV